MTARRNLEVWQMPTDDRTFFTFLGTCPNCGEKARMHSLGAGDFRCSKCEKITTQEERTKAMSTLLDAIAGSMNEQQQNENRRLNKCQYSKKVK
jgi:tRNA(Ile2) C34 agmatinyltransferase TiaS